MRYFRVPCRAINDSVHESFNYNEECMISVASNSNVRVYSFEIDDCYINTTWLSIEVIDKLKALSVTEQERFGTCQTCVKYTKEYNNEKEFLTELKNMQSGWKMLGELLGE